MRKAYSYIRMSTDKQLKGDSLRRQLEASEKFAYENNLQLINSVDGIPLEDIGVSAFKSDNSTYGALSKFLQLLDEGKIEKNSILLVESLDRLSRDKVTDALSQFLNIIKQDIEIITLVDNQRYTKENADMNVGSLFVSLGIMFRANEESRTKSIRLKAAWGNKRINAINKPLTKIAPSWLKYNEKSGAFEVIPEKADTVRLIFQLCASSLGLWSIANYLNQNNFSVFKNGKYWHRSYISKIIKNRAVLGEFQACTLENNERKPIGDPILNYYPQIIDEVSFNLANAAISDRTINNRGRKGENFTNIFTGLVYCGKCGSKMTLRNRGAAPKGGKYLVCTKKRSGAGCDMPEWRLDLLVTHILKHLEEIDFSELLGSDSVITKINSEITAINYKISEIKGKIENIQESLINNKLDQDSRTLFIDKLGLLQSNKNDEEKLLADMQSQLFNHNEENALFKSNELKNIIEKYKNNSEDFLFRATLSRILNKAIAKISLFIEKFEYYPWEYDDDNEIVTNFLKFNQQFEQYKVDELVKSDKFKKFASDYNKRIQIEYKTNINRQILIGTQISFANYPNLNKKI